MKHHSRSAHWAQIISGFDGSQTTVRDYCRKQNVNEHSFYCWRRRLNEKTKKPLTFRLVEPERKQPAAPPLAPVEVVLTSGTVLRVACEERALRTVLAAIA